MGCLFFLLSPDGGHSFHWLTNFPGNSSIMVFTSSPFDGKFAFLTDDQQVFLCLKRLRSLLESRRSSAKSVWCVSERDSDG